MNKTNKKLITILIFIAITIIFFSCSRYKKISKSDIDKFRSRNDTIYYDNIPVAIFTNVEWEYYRNHKVMEISVNQIKKGSDEMTDKIVDYIIYLHPKAKAEVKIPR